MYDDAAAWQAGPAKVYDLLAAAAIAQVTGDLTGLLALDAGCGTGAAGRALAARGAQVLSVDLSESMVRLAPGHRFVADIARLPLRDDSIWVSAACTVLSHVDDPLSAVRELARVTKPGGTVAITAFPAAAGQPVLAAAAGQPVQAAEAGQPVQAAAAGHAVKAVADRVLAAAGYREPDWYRAVKSTGETAVGSPEALHRLAAAAGLAWSRVATPQVELAGLTSDELVAWRLGMAPVAAWLTVHNGLTGVLAKEIKAALPSVINPLSLLVLTAGR